MQIIHGDALEKLLEMPDESVHTCITSPPYYGLRDYGMDGQIGMEDTPDDYVLRLVEVFREVRRVLRKDGTLWVVIGDSYAGSWHGRNADGAASEVNENKRNKGSRAGTLKKHGNTCKPKDLIGIPWMLAFALRADGWYLRQDIIWQKTNAMPESVKDRCTKSHEYIFLLAKSRKYFFNAQAIQEQPNGKRNNPVAGSAGAFGPQQARKRGSGHTDQGKRNKRDVWSVGTSNHKWAHFAVFPEMIVEPCILAGSPPGGTVLDPFAGSGTCGAVAKRTGRDFIGIELNQEYCDIARKRIAEAVDRTAPKKQRRGDRLQGQQMIEGF